jgi:hypothetical protein
MLGLLRLLVVRLPAAAVLLLLGLLLLALCVMLNAGMHAVSGVLGVKMSRTGTGALMLSVLVLLMPMRLVWSALLSLSAPALAVGAVLLMMLTVHSASACKTCSRDAFFGFCFCSAGLLAGQSSWQGQQSSEARDTLDELPCLMLDSMWPSPPNPICPVRPSLELPANRAADYNDWQKDSESCKQQRVQQRHRHCLEKGCLR